MLKQLKLLLFSVACIAGCAAMLLLLSPTTVAGIGAFEVIASQLEQPRHLAFGPDGSLYVTEAGAGGPTCANPDPGNPDFAVCIGQTGAVTKVDPQGNQSRLADDLYSIAVYFEPAEPPQISGPHGIDVTPSGEVFVTIGLGADPAERELLFGAQGLNLGQLVEVEQNGAWSNWVDIAAHEATNPDGGIIDSNPYGLHAIDDLTFYAVDAGGNDLLRVTLQPVEQGDGGVETIAVFPTRDVPPPFPPPPPTIPMESVPTSIALAGNSVLVGELTGFPFVVGMANVYDVIEPTPPVVAYTGFTNIGDIARDDAGNLYVLEIATNSLLSGDITGAIHRVAPDGTRVTIVNNPCDPGNPTGSELCFPTGMEIGPDGALYVSNYGVFGAAPPPAPSGQVVRIEITDPTAVTLSEMGTLQQNRGTGLALAALVLLGSATALHRSRRRDA